MDATLSAADIKGCGIGILSIFDTVFWFLTIFVATLCYCYTRWHIICLDELRPTFLVRLVMIWSSSGKCVSSRGGRKGLRWCGFALFLVRFCGNFHFNSRYCGFKALSGLWLLQLLTRGFRWKKMSAVITLFRTVGRWSVCSCFANATQVFCFTTYQGSLYQLTV